MGVVSHKKKREIQPKIKNVKINLRYRDEVCSGCGSKFRAGYACDGYFHLIGIGYHSVGDKREAILCSDCSQTVYRILGRPNMEDSCNAPTKLYSFNTKTDNFSKRPKFMMINGKHMKYDGKILLKAVEKHSEKMKRKNPWSNVDYYKLAGVKKPRRIN